MDSDFFKSDFTSMNLQPLQSTQKSSYNDFANAFGAPDPQNVREQRRAGDLVSNLLNRQKEMKSSDPFELLRDLTTANAMADKNSEARKKYQAFMQKTAPTTGTEEQVADAGGFRGFGDLPGAGNEN